MLVSLSYETAADIKRHLEQVYGCEHAWMVVNLRVLYQSSYRASCLSSQGELDQHSGHHVYVAIWPIVPRVPLTDSCKPSLFSYQLL